MLKQKENLYQEHMILCSVNQKKTSKKEKNYKKKKKFLKKKQEEINKQSDIYKKLCKHVENTRKMFDKQ